jgi:hypothetical protein
MILIAKLAGQIIKSSTLAVIVEKTLPILIKAAKQYR